MSGIYEGWEQLGFLRDVIGQKAQGFPPLAHLHSSDLHPWPHQTDPHLTADKEPVSDIATVLEAQNHKKSQKMYCLPEGLPVRRGGSLRPGLSDGAENGSTPDETINTQEQFSFCEILIFGLAACMHTNTHLCLQGKPILCPWC